MIKLDNIYERFPFLSGVRHHGREIIGIIQNSDDKIITMYDFSLIRTEEQKREFIQLGQTWWNESNRSLPINIFLTGKMVPFRSCLRTILNRDLEIMFGPVTCLNDIIKKRVKKKQIQLIRRID